MSGDYSAERFEPTAPNCGASTIHITFNGTQLSISGISALVTRRSSSVLRPGATTFPAVSGAPDAHGNFDYSAARQAMRNRGPIPEGRYWINPSEMWERDFLRWLVHSESHQHAWGDYRLTIHPFPSSNTHGRGGFFIHGGRNPGSIGCIDLTSHMPNFVRMLRYGMGERRDCHIELEVDYP